MLEIPFLFPDLLYFFFFWFKVQLQPGKEANQRYQYQQQQQQQQISVSGYIQCNMQYTICICYLQFASSFRFFPVSVSSFQASELPSFQLQFQLQVPASRLLA